MLRLLQGNRSGLVGCGFWNDGCGGLNLALVWQVAYAIIFGLIVVVFPFMIFFYEADDEGLATEDAARAAGKNVNCLTTLCDFSGCWRAGLSAIVYTMITVVISAIVIVLMYVFLNDTEIPYKLTAVSVATVAFQPADTPIAAKCAAGATNCLQPCGTGTCNWVNNTLNISVSGHCKQLLSFDCEQRTSSLLCDASACAAVALVTVAGQGLTHVSITTLPRGPQRPRCGNCYIIKFDSHEAWACSFCC